MEGPILAAFVQRMDDSIRKKLNKETYLLIVDGREARKDSLRVVECRTSFEALVNAANTSHFPQPANQTPNKKFISKIKTGFSDKKK